MGTITCLSHRKVSPAGQKVILTIRDSDEKWWKSWCGFFTQESKRHAIGDINLGIILNKASEHGYMGPKFQVMYEVGRIVCSRYLRNSHISFSRLKQECTSHIVKMQEMSIKMTQISPALFDTKWSVKKQIENIVKEETRLKQSYRKD